MLAAPVFTADTPPATATVGTAYSYAFTASGNPAPSFHLGSGTLPAGLSLNTTSGVLSGTPTTAGPSTLTITAANGVTPDAATPAQTITVSTSAPPPPPSGPADLQVSIAGPLFAGPNQPIVFTVTVTNHSSTAAGSAHTTVLTSAGYPVVDNGGATVVGSLFGPTLDFASPGFAVGQTISYTITLKTPPGFSAALIAAVALSTTPDPNLFNNIALAPTLSF